MNFNKPLGATNFLSHKQPNRHQCSSAGLAVKPTAQLGSHHVQGHDKAVLIPVFTFTFKTAPLINSRGFQNKRE